jgi:hypothetical protein
MKQLLNWDKYDIETKKFYDYDFFFNWNQSPKFDKNKRLY